ncbi:MAG: hypothetical protein ACE5PV_02820 [Candidatus Poribacteria bacterium]
MRHWLVIIVCLTILGIASHSIAQHGNKVAVVRGDLSGSAHIMLKNLGEKVDDYPQNADLWGKAKDYWCIWVGWPNSNVTVRNDFKKNGDTFKAWLKAGGAFVATTASSDIHEIYELLPGKVRTHNQHSSREQAHVVAKNHKIVNEPNDITDDAYYAGWAWTAGDNYAEWEGYIVITTEDKAGKMPSWLVHESMPIVVTTIQPTWSGHMHPKMVENIWHYVKTFKATSVASQGKLASTWGDVKRLY